MGQKECSACSLESRHTRHTACWSSRQKSFSFSLWALQTASPPDEDLGLRSCWKVSHMFFKARFNVGSFTVEISLHMGHSWIPLLSQNAWMQSEQMLWLQGRRTGFTKKSKHTGQVKSTSVKPSDAILHATLSGLQLHIHAQQKHTYRVWAKQMRCLSLYPEGGARLCTEKCASFCTMQINRILEVSRCGNLFISTQGSIFFY